MTAKAETRGTQGQESGNPDMMDKKITKDTNKGMLGILSFLRALCALGALGVIESLKWRNATQFGRREKTTWA